MYSGTKVIRPLLKWFSRHNRHTIVLIHDIEHLRSNNPSGSATNDELEFLNLFSHIICHNQSMKQYLSQQGIDENKLIVLGVFDYLTDYNIQQSDHSNPKSVVVAGNLDPSKCGYIYSFADNNPTITINLYGVNLCDNHAKNIFYQGKFNPDELPGIINGDYGLIWDGCSIDTCEGNMGQYLRFNNPHKLSLYLVSGIPVIAWSKAAISSFVKDNRCGILVDDLFDLKDVFANISSRDYLEMQESCLNIAEKLKTGCYFKESLSETGALCNE